MLKKLFFSLTLLGYSYVSQAQQVVSSPQPNPEDVGDVVAELATSLSTLDGSRITTGVLVNRTVPLSDPHPFNGTASSPNNTYSEWQQQYWQFYQASLSTSALPTPADLYDRVQAKIETGQTGVAQE
ncbi:hypothetical protein DNI29_22520 [Hymenobacter sediminis]|uniref:hypothetical protein n=1 Tax=Hymenobacter sediminis TaxID=2218621 RepID=UPI000DA6A1DD|nr:hypothetical protein [Hymenobacter sediminis]RPD43890.1 hypothetical protein DNI29_22520 [Hymenobacter sediminis]